jgi:hypothetical protein
LSFFDDGDDEAPATAQRVPRSPRPRRPSAAAGRGTPDHQTLMVRRGVALVVGLVLLILIIVGISGCLKSQRRSALESYNRNVSSIGTEAVQQVAQPLFKAISGASSKNALDVELQIDQLKMTAQDEASRAKGLSVPGEMAGAQRNFELTADFRASAVGKIAEQIRSALGTTGAGGAEAQIAGQMEVLLASDVVYAQRVVPLIQQALNDNGIHDQPTSPSRFIDDLGWLDPNTVGTRLTGSASATTSGTVAPGPHGHSLSAVSVGANALAQAPAVNRVAGGSNPTFTVQVANGGGSTEHNVKVDVTVEAGGKKITATKTIDTTQPGQTASVDIPVTGVPLSTAARVTVNIEAVPGEKNLANNKGTFTAVFGP